MGGFHQLMVMQKIIYNRYYRCMRIHKEAFDALVQLRAENITDMYLTISSELADILLSVCENPSLPQEKKAKYLC